MKFFLKILQWLVEGVDVIFRIVCQISGQDNVRCKIQKSNWHFHIKKFCSNYVECRYYCYNQSKRLLSKCLF